MAETGCRYFTGYKPCGKNPTCSISCPHRDVPRLRLLVIHLEALGSVVRSTALLPAVKRKYPSSHITWVTAAPADQLLQGNPWVDRVLTLDNRDLLALRALHFDVAFCLDKSLASAGVLAQTHADQVFGFCADARTGALLPATPAADELWQVGLNDHQKFYVNQKTELRLLHEALELGPYLRDEYQMPLTAIEQKEALARHERWLDRAHLVVGLNTGCSNVMAHKKLSVAGHRDLVRALQHMGPLAIVLLGGPDDEVRNQQIASGFNVIQSPTQRGLRDGLVSVAACDLVVSGDSLGLHMAIAMQKWTVAWFGPTCAQEVDLYDRGVKVMTQAACSPCWKRTCQNSPMCYDLVNQQDILSGIEQGRQWLLKTSSFKQPLLETSFSPSL